MKHLYLIIAAIAYCAGVFAGTIKGHVTDGKGTPLPFATIYIQGTTIGTSANADGVYQLTLAAGNHKIVCQYMGFKQSIYSVTVKGDEAIMHDFSLEEQSLQLKEYTVKSTDDPALYIMRKVIARRSFHRQQIKEFQTGIYLKTLAKTRQMPKKFMGQDVTADDMGLDSNGKGILYLAEEDATYYAKGNKHRTIIHSVHESGDPSGVGLSTFPDVISFYDNNIEISDQIVPRGFVSPVSDYALTYYKYRLEGDFTEGGRTIYKISVTPKRPYEPVFVSGILYVVDEEWAIHSLNVLATKKSNMQLLDTMRIEQLYLPLQKDEWVIKQQVLYFTLNLLGFDMTGNMVTVYSDQKINQSLPDTIFHDKIISEYDKGANKKDTSYWAAARPIPLQVEETRDYIEKDSLRLIYNDPVYKDSIRRRNNKISVGDVVLNGIRQVGKKEKYTIGTNSLLTGLVNFNTVEGLNIAPKITGRYKIDSFNHIIGAVAARYGFSNTHFNAIGKFAYLKQNKDWLGRWWMAGFEAGKYIFQFNPNNPIEGFYNTISTLFYRKNYLKIYERWNTGVFFSRNYGNGLRWTAQLDFQQRLPLENTTDFNFAKSTVGGFTDNIPDEFKSMSWVKHNAVIAKVSVSYQPGYKYIQYPDYKRPLRSEWPVFTLSYQRGIPDLLDSKVDYDKWRFGIRDEIGLKLLGTFQYNIAAGGFLSDKYVSIPDLNHIQGNQLTIATPYLESFQTAPYYQYSNKQPLYGEAHIQWNLRGFITNKIPLLKQLGWWLVAGGNAYYVNEDLYHTELFVGLDNIGYDKYRLFRFDFVQSWNSLDQKTAAFRIGIATTSLISISFSDTNGEW